MARGQGWGAATALTVWLAVGCGDAERLDPPPSVWTSVHGAGAGGAGGADPDPGAGGAGGASTGGGGQPGSGGATCAAGWVRDIQTGTPQSDEMLAIAVDASDHLYVVGYEAGITGVANIEPVGDAQAVITKYAPSGTPVWRHVVSSTAADVAEDVLLHPASGEVYIAGRTTGSLDGFTNQGKYDLFVSILSPDGAPLHTYQWGDERPQHGKRMALDPAGALIIAGYNETYVPTNYVESWEDPFVIRLKNRILGDGSRELAEDWWHQYHTDASDYLLGGAVDDDGSIFVGGMHASGQDKGAVVRKMNADGSAGWIHHISTFFEDLVYDVAISPAGELYVTGATFLELGAKSFGQQDVFVARLDKSTGDVLWIAQAGWESSDFPTSLTFDAAGNIYVAGSTWLAGETGTDLFAMRFNPSGDLLGTWRRGTPAHEEIWGAAVDSCGRMFVVGYTEGALVAGAQHAGGRDAFILGVNW